MPNKLDMNGNELILDADADTSITADTDDQIDFKTGGSDRVIIDSSGNLLVGGTSTTPWTLSSGSGAVIRSEGYAGFAASSSALELNRIGSDGNIASFRKDGTTSGTIFTNSSIYMGLGSSDVGLLFLGDAEDIRPWNPSTNSVRDDAIDLGNGDARFDNIFATNTSITTSDQNEKQDIASITNKELNVAKKLSTLFKTFRWKSRVAKKGDKARTHSGIIAQDIQSAFSAEGLDASNYGLFTSDTWTNEDGKEQTRLGVRYPELFSFIFSSIEARLTALESK